MTTENTTTSNYVPLQLKTHYSLLLGYNKSEKLMPKLKEYGIKSCAITDYGSISGNVDFFKEATAAEIKPILGCTLYVCDGPSENKGKENQKLSYLTLLCKNLAGWKELIKIVSYSNRPAGWCNKPRISLAELRHFTLTDFICLTGGIGSVLANSIFNDRKLAYNGDELGQLRANWKDLAEEKIIELEGLFGQENVFVEISLDEPNTNGASQLLSKFWRVIKEKNDRVKLVAAPNCHYTNQDDAIDHRILLCSYTGKDLPSIPKYIADFDEHTLGLFFLSDKYYLRKALGEEYTKEEIDNTLAIDRMIESFDILGKPSLPHFPCPDGKTETDYLRELCREGWKKKSKKIPKDKWKEYGDRVNYELGVIEEKGFSGYFLILADIIKWCESQGWLCGPGRGSAANCLISFLSNITKIDSVKYNLIFSRFLNPGRKGLPDIDFDVPMSHRNEVIKYIEDKYGKDRVYQMITYGNLKGRSALKEVLRANGSISFSLMNMMTEPIPDEAKIADELQEDKEKGGVGSIIRWTLENRAKDLREWCFINDNGELEGTYAKLFEQAIRLENTKRSQSKHASGVVVSSNPFVEVCPLIYDKSNDSQVAGCEMEDIESLGLVKLDCLGLSALDRIMKVREILKYG